MPLTPSGIVLNVYTTAQRDALPTPEQGTLIYNSTTNQVEMYTGTAWAGTSSSSGGIVTPEGGFAVSLVNASGAILPKGYAVEPSPGTDNGVIPCSAGDINPIGFVYSNIAIGASGLIVIAGRCQVYLNNAGGGTRAQWISMNTSTVPGQVVAAASPPSQAIHFEECGHLIQSVGAAGLCYAIVHFN